jgi:RNA polymerase sigma-70 factor (ECF subfamily)
VTQGNDRSFTPGESPAEDALDKLIVTVARGESGAFDALFRHLSGPVYRTALAVIRDPAHAEEVSQEVLIEIWRTAGPFRSGPGQRGLVGPHDSPPPRHRPGPVHDRGHRPRAAQRRVPVSWDQVSETVEDILDRERLTYSLDRLSGPQRQAIMLAFYGGHTHNEIAVILGVAVGTVKSRIRIGLAKLRDSMAPRIRG